MKTALKVNTEKRQGKTMRPTVVKTVLKVNTEKRQGKTMRPKVVKIAPLENTGTERGRRHQALARTAIPEPLRWKKERHNVRFARQGRTAQMPRPAGSAPLENTGTERGSQY